FFFFKKKKPHLLLHPYHIFFLYTYSFYSFFFFSMHTPFPSNILYTFDFSLITVILLLLFVMIITKRIIPSIILFGIK
ncbi:uncharacterized protein BX664DRAFT_336248, partial [Halteromyces radiatus]|uniref:uncharacterized protein n=1 Tax=Halteromyces radiatus TaxID=101107 RepID=UPI0022200C47